MPLKIINVSSLQMETKHHFLYEASLLRFPVDILILSKTMAESTHQLEKQFQDALNILLKDEWGFFAASETDKLIQRDLCGVYHNL